MMPGELEKVPQCARKRVELTPCLALLTRGFRGYRFTGRSQFQNWASLHEAKVAASQQPQRCVEETRYGPTEGSTARTRRRSRQVSGRGNLRSRGSGDRPADHADDAPRLMSVAERTWSIEW